MSCGLVPQQFCPVYQTCDANFMNFMYVLCFYYYTFFPFDIYRVLANLPMVVLFIPPLVVSLLIYILYLIDTPIEYLLSFFIPSITALAIPFTFIMLAGLVHESTILKIFK